MNARFDEETILSEFRRWFDDARTETASDGGRQPPEEEQKQPPPVGLYQLVEEFTALRQELKLQTKSSRNLAEQSETTLKAMQEAIELFRSVDAKESQAARRATRPLIQSLLDLDEALQRGRTVIETARRRILEDLAGDLRDQLDDLFSRQPPWRRWLCRRWHETAGQLILQRAALGHRQVFDSLIEGYGLILGRLKRIMKKEGVYRIQCLGKPVNPNTMTVVEAVDDPMQPPGVVVEEVRPGYYWKNKVIRFAEVRAIQGKIS